MHSEDNGLTKYKMTLVCLLFAFLLTACGENEELTAYQEDMNTFFERAAEYNDKMNAIDRESDTAVIELLGYLDAFAEDIQHCLECGMNAHIAKPIDINNLIQHLQKYLEV